MRFDCSRPDARRDITAHMQCVDPVTRQPVALTGGYIDDCDTIEGWVQDLRRVAGGFARSRRFVAFVPVWTVDVVAYGPCGEVQRRAAGEEIRPADIDVRWHPAREPGP